MRRFTWSLVSGVIAAGLIVGVALAALPAQVDPSTVPTGFFVSPNRIEHDRAHIKPFQRVLKQKDGADIFVQHGRFAPGQSTGWHTHPGPVIVTVVAGTLTLYDGMDKGCTPRTFGPGQGFIDPGFGHVHLARNESGSEAADFYATYVLPAGAEDVRTTEDAPGNCPASVT